MTETTPVRAPGGLVPDHGELSTAKRALLDQWRAGRWSDVPGGIPAAPSGPVARASVQQLELWNLHQRSPGTTSPNISFAAILPADVDVDALTYAVEHLSRRHEALRTTLWADDGAVWQQIHQEPLAGLLQVDLSALPSLAAEARALELANEAVSQPFDLVRGPLLRVLLYRLGPSRHMLAVVVHHAIADGWSLAIAMNETAALYEAYTTGATVTLPPLPVQYRDFAHWQWQWMDSPEAAEHASYWERRIAPHCASLLPPDFSAGAPGDMRGGLADIVLTPTLCAAVRRLAAAERASVFMVLLAAFAAVLHERTHEQLVSIGTPVAGRHRPETRALVGCFASMVPTFVPITGQTPFRELLSSTRAEAASAVTHEAYPLDIYLNRVEPDREFASRPLFAAQFGLQPPMQPFRLADVRLQPVTLNRGQTRTPLAVHLWDSELSIHGTVGYSLALFRQSTINTMAERYIEIIERVTDDPMQPVGKL